jgi:hypothetical protein
VSSPGALAAVSPEASVEATDAQPDQPDVIITATSPTNVQFRADGQDVVVRAMPHRPDPRRKEVVRQGMMIGAAIGVLAGLASGVANDRQQSMSGTECDTIGCGVGGAVIGSAVYGAIGLGLGAAVGAIVGRLGYP